MNRLALVLVTALVSVSACSGSDEPAAGDATPSATASADTADAAALSEVDGVDVWDLSGEPSPEAFGIVPPATSADYSGDEGRPVRFEISGQALELDLADLTFYGPEGVYAFLSRTEELPADELKAVYRDALEQLGVDVATADTFDAELDAAPTDEAGNVSTAYPDEIRVGDWTFAVSAAISPSIGTGVVTVSAGHRPLPSA